ncbi:hypothetical protein AAE02nite_45280 [Adhaeribacter aerolatus]|uniref:DUF3308 domain-containing protein n=1 Tax=Adhaeribacter aerolatus TaxID=670289 RepID=A0A512B4F5_9BACT|nr:hypothetical protein [Adhaeribacter aerolatus]GEO06864.1 hypothetical protein AAE02nite_45280 [Adhaeribacter aerolatus]
MKYKIPLLLSFVLFLSSAQADNYPNPAGARTNGLAGVAVTLADVWAVSNNIAGITALKKPAAGVYAENRFNLKALSTVTLQGVYPIAKQGALGIELMRFGDKLYNEQKLGLGYAHRIGPVSLGLKATLLQLHLEQLGSRRAVALSFGGQSEIIPKLTFGAHIFNFNQAKLASYQNERFPTVMQAGLAYQPSAKLLLSLETEKDLEHAADLKGGLEYKPITQLALRTGFSTARQAATAGVGFVSRQFSIDYALGSHSVLGISNHLSISFGFE